MTKGIAYQKGQALEKQGKKAEALELYVETQGEVCDPANPYEEGAAKRAAPIGLELGTAAEKARRLQKGTATSTGWAAISRSRTRR